MIQSFTLGSFCTNFSRTNDVIVLGLLHGKPAGQKDFLQNIAFQICICYNASRQRRSEVLQAVQQQKAPVFQHRGFSIPNLGNGRA